MNSIIISSKTGNICEFLNKKKQILNNVDASRKGTIDVPIRKLVEEINSHDAFFTTSSCSGRVILFCEGSTKKKHLCKWLFISHNTISEEEFIDKIDVSQGNMTLKFEPMILHVQCLSLEFAKKLHTCALEAGFRNSGITLGKHSKITVAVRSCLGLEVPISNEGKLLVSTEFLKFLVMKSNEKMEENENRKEKFFEIFQRAFRKSEL